MPLSADKQTNRVYIKKKPVYHPPVYKHVHKKHHGHGHGHYGK